MALAPTVKQLKYYTDYAVPSVTNLAARMYSFHWSSSSSTGWMYSAGKQIQPRDINWPYERDKKKLRDSETCGMNISSTWGMSHLWLMHRLNFNRNRTKRKYPLRCSLASCEKTNKSEWCVLIGQQLKAVQCNGDMNNSMYKIYSSVQHLKWTPWLQN